MRGCIRADRGSPSPALPARGRGVLLRSGMVLRQAMSRLVSGLAPRNRRCLRLILWPRFVGDVVAPTARPPPRPSPQGEGGTFAVRDGLTSGNVPVVVVADLANRDPVGPDPSDAGVAGPRRKGQGGTFAVRDGLASGSVPIVVVAGLANRDPVGADPVGADAGDGGLGDADAGDADSRRGCRRRGCRPPRPAPQGGGRHLCGQGWSDVRQCPNRRRR